MKKLLGLGLAGLLSLSTNVNALETKAEGYEVPDKKNTNLIMKDVIGNSNNIKLNYYTRPDGSGFAEVLFNNKTGAYIIFSKIYELNHIIQDKNCDSVFETKYSKEEAKTLPVPECFLNKK
ncbi:hypothetical protein HYX19_04120 [Candidatus Woesearchaeota archaeon]|nr:hypothetical protein [Candidatus Woesearchaeota archaeon]